MPPPIIATREPTYLNCRTHRRYTAKQDADPARFSDDSGARRSRPGGTAVPNQAAAAQPALPGFRPALVGHAGMLREPAGDQPQPGPAGCRGYPVPALHLQLAGL